MDLPINVKDLKTIVDALALGGDTRLYFLLKNIVEEEKRLSKGLDTSDKEVKVYSESDDYKCKYGECDI